MSNSNVHSLESLPSIILKKGKEKAVNQKHPWIFSGAIQKYPIESEVSLVKCLDTNHKLLSIGLYTYNESISVRNIWFFGQSGNPTKQEYWDFKITTALALRINAFENTNCFRAINSEGDGLPGFTLDIFGEVAVLQTKFPFFQPFTISLVSQLVGKLGHLLVFSEESHFEGYYSLLDPTPNWIRDIHLVPDNLKTVFALENGMQLVVPILGGQKTGLFLDQRRNRADLKSRSFGKSVLNTFCYTGGFSIAAGLGGASRVCSVDISKDALEWGKKSWGLNFRTSSTDLPTNNIIPPLNVDWIKADVFEYLRKEKEEFDIVILDPPAFAKSKASIPRAARGYKDINRLGMLRVKKGGLLYTFTCSQKINWVLFQQIVFSAALDSGREVTILDRLGPGEDHPVSIYHPEGEYLKGFLLRVN